MLILDYDCSHGWFGIEVLYFVALQAPVSFSRTCKRVLPQKLQWVLFLIDFVLQPT
jgi:hypothetical protein